MGSGIWRRFGIGVSVCVCASALAACGGRPDATGEWTGQVEFQEGGQVAAANLRLSLAQSEGGSVNGTGQLSVQAEGETQELELSSVTGRVEDSGDMTLEATDDRFLSDTEVSLEGSVSGGTMEGNTRMNLEGILSDPVTVAGDFDLERQEEE